jgi:hypothetical protein
MSVDLWVKNSISNPSEKYPDGERNCHYLSSVIAFFILVHSRILHGSKYDTVRRCTDLSALLVLLWGPLLGIIETSKNRAVTVAVIRDFILDGMFITAIQMCDFYLFYTRYLAIQRMGWWSRMLNHWFIWILATMTWLPTFTIVPFFVNTRSFVYGRCFTLLFITHTFLTFFYNIYYTFICVQFLIKVSYWESTIKTFPECTIMSGENVVSGNAVEIQSVLCKNSDPFDRLNFPVTEQEEGEQRLSRPWVRVIKIIAWKSIGHAITSTAISIAFLLDFRTSYVWPLVKLLGMHLWFNWRLEKVLCPGPSVGDSQSANLNRQGRELIVMLWARQPYAAARSAAWGNISLASPPPAGAAAAAPGCQGAVGTVGRVEEQKSQTAIRDDNRRKFDRMIRGQRALPIGIVVPAAGSISSWQSWAPFAGGAAPSSC